MKKVIDYYPYTGVGSRQTPEDVLVKMAAIARRLAEQEFTLRSGRAEGADTAFEEGCDRVGGKKEIFVPWEGFGGGCATGCACTAVIGEAPHTPGIHTDENRELCRQAAEIAERIHPAWDACTDNVRLLHTRNIFQVLGDKLDTPSEALICWTPSGQHVGGTRTAIVLALEHRIPVYNLATLRWPINKIIKRITR